LEPPVDRTVFKLTRHLDAWEKDFIRSTCERWASSIFGEEEVQKNNRINGLKQKPDPELTSYRLRIKKVEEAMSRGTPCSLNERLEYELSCLIDDSVSRLEAELEEVASKKKRVSRKKKILALFLAVNAIVGNIGKAMMKDVDLERSARAFIEEQETSYVEFIRKNQGT